MLDLFSPLEPGVRRDGLVAYRQFLAQRDGEVDVESRTLARREQGMQRFMRPLPRVREMDRELFRAQYENFDRKKKTPPEMLLLIGLVKVNAAETYGVSQSFDKVYRRAIESEDDLELVLLIEETYHTRILLSSAILYGIDVASPYRPHAGLRALIGGINHAPDFISRPLVLAGEILGTLSFIHLLHKAREILGHDPELCDAVEERVSEILVDEIGHVSFNRMCLGAAGLAETRLLLPAVVMGLSSAVPELGMLGALAAGVSDELALLNTERRLPEHVRKAAFIA
jgi:hypothetical protein